MKKLAHIVLFLVAVSRLTGQPSQPGGNTLTDSNSSFSNLYRGMRQANDGSNLLLSLVNHDEYSDFLSLAKIESTSGSEGTISILDLANPTSASAKIKYKIMRLSAGSMKAGDDNGTALYSPYYTRVGVKEYAVVQNRYGAPFRYLLKSDILTSFPPTMIIPDSWLSPVANLLTDSKAKSLKDIKPENLLTTASQSSSIEFLVAAVKLANDNPVLFAKNFPAMLSKSDEVSVSILTRMLVISSVASRNGGNITAGAAIIQDSDLPNIIPPLEEAAQNATAQGAIRGILFGIGACQMYDHLRTPKVAEIFTILKGKENTTDPAWADTDAIIDHFNKAPQ